MAVSGFDWDDANAEHVARHGFSPEEVEEVFEGRSHVRRARLGRYVALGETLDGRLAFIVFERRKERIRVITARDMSISERRLYRRNV